MQRTGEESLENAEARLFGRLGLDVKTHYVECPETSSVVRVFDVGSGPACLCIHGSPNSAATWGQLASAMPDRRMLLLERPGAGLSGRASWGDHRVQVVALMKRTLDAVAEEKVDVIGSSFGAFYAYYLSHDAPERVRSLILMGAPGGVTGRPMPFIFRLLCLPGTAAALKGAFKPTHEGAAKAFRDIGHGDALDRGAIPHELLDWYAALVGHGAVLGGTTDEVRAVATPFGFRRGVILSAEEMASLRPPVLYVWGSEDTFGGRSEGDHAASLTPGAKIVHLDRFGHLPWVDDPRRVADVVSEFWSEHGL